MGTEKRLIVRQAHTLEREVDAALAALSAQLDAAQASAIMMFCAPTYDLAELAHKIATCFSVPVVACTTENQLGERGYQNEGITAVSLRSSELRVTPYLISPLSECQARASEAAFFAMSGMLERGSERAFGFVLADGASRAEERLAASLYQSLGTIPLIGGAPLAPPSSEATYVYHQGQFVRNAALLALFETTLPFTTFKLSHAHPGRQKLVVTAADPEQRIVHEFNGEPAAEAYAEALGVDVEELDPGLFSQNSLLLRSGTEHFTRSVRGRNADQSLSFFCALEEGLVLSVGEVRDPVPALERCFEDVRARIGEPEVVLGCIATLRRNELDAAGTRCEVGDLLANQRVVGFSGYGAQYNAIYLNQTLSAVALSG